ncbi:ScbR family autoregulator-binding transcription factor [Streptomyces sp. NPDC101118]|uniref:ScbR family autoregulator-binding transcription factor n=1 Tax=Streptomyces sp. NPDC101118 TaxID=3366109 RepID=UPI00380C2C2B
MSRMERPMVKQDRAVRTRQAILEAAATVFEERGYDAAKLTDIVKIAQVTKGALYFHFDSKEDLAQAVIDAQVHVEPTHTPQDFKAQEFVDVGMIFSYRLKHDILMRGSARLTLDQTGRSLARSGPFHGWIDLNSGILAEAKERGELLPHVDPVATARLVVGAYAGINLMSQTLQGSDLDEQVSTLYTLLMPSLVIPAVAVLLDTLPGRGGRALGALAPDLGAAADIAPEEEVAADTEGDCPSCRTDAAPGVPAA